MNKSISNNKRKNRWKKFMENLSQKRSNEVETIQPTTWHRGYMENGSEKTISGETTKVEK